MIWHCLKISIVYLLISVGLICASPRQREYVSRARLNDGLHEINVFVNGIRSVEIVADPQEDSHDGLVVRQISNHKQLVNMIYNGIPHDLESNEHTTRTSSKNGLVLKQCQVVKSKQIVSKFVNKFDAGFTGARAYENQPSNISIAFLDGNSTVPMSLQQLTNFHDLKHQCFTHRRYVRKLAHSKNQHMKQNRTTRSLGQLLVFPGTKWCGNKRLARSYRDLDGHTSTDSCCRDHDLCPISIPFLTTKYGLYNKFLTTISHCACDRRFKTCLKRTGTNAADIVGRVFFNIVQSKCFVLDRQKVCLKYGLWSCYKWGYEKRAVIKEPSQW